MSSPRRFAVAGPDTHEDDRHLGSRSTDQGGCDTVGVVNEILLISGRTGRDDPWHDFDATSAAVAAIIRDSGLAVTVRESAAVEAADFADADMLVVNCGADSPPGADPAATAAFLDLLASDRPLLALHASVLAFSALPQWANRLGVRWVPGASMHPPIGPVAEEPDATHPIGAGLGLIEVYDERYAHLELRYAATTVLAHGHDGTDHPLCLAREDPGGRRTVYDALGHGVESYRSASRRDLLRREMTWLRRVQECADRPGPPGRAHGAVPATGG